MDEQINEQTESFEQPEQDFGFEDNFENAFDVIGKDIEDSCNELTKTLDNLDF